MTKIKTTKAKPSPKLPKKSKTTKPKSPTAAARAQDARRKAIYNCSSEEYEAVKAFQGGKCFISGKIPKTSLHIDHDHKNGKLRGLLDPWVNKGLSYFQDNPIWLRKAAEYLENPPFTQVLGEDVFGVLGKVTKKPRNRRYGPPPGTKTPQSRDFTAIQRKNKSIQEQNIGTTT